MKCTHSLVLAAASIAASPTGVTAAQAAINLRTYSDDKEIPRVEADASVNIGATMEVTYFGHQKRFHVSDST